MRRSIDRIVCKHCKPSEDARAAWGPGMHFRCPLRIAKEYYLGHTSSLVVNKRARRQLIAS